jgi:hypothetical protein
MLAKGMDTFRTKIKPDIVVFRWRLITGVINSLSYIRRTILILLLSRVARLREKNSMTPQQIFWQLATTNENLLYATFTDLV